MNDPRKTFVCFKCGCLMQDTSHQRQHGKETECPRCKDKLIKAEMLLANEPLKEMSVDQLLTVKQYFTDKINGPENNGRVTADGSADLDYWFDMQEECEAELLRKGFTATIEEVESVISNAHKNNVYNVVHIDYGG